MLPAFLLSLREGLEMALIIGILLGALQKLHRNDLKRTVWIAVLSAGLLSLAFAILLQALGATLKEPYEQIFEGTLMLTAAGVLTWMIFWMQRQARYLKGNIETEMRLATQKNGKRAVFTLAFVSVLREGVELALFFTAAAMAAGQNPAVIGALVGLAVATLLGWLLFATTVRLDMRRFFQVTSILLLFFAAGLVAHGVHEFVEVGLLPGLIDPVWNSGAILSEDSLFGSTLKALFGYNENPALIEVLAYIGYLAAVLIGLRRSRQPATTPA